MTRSTPERAHRSDLDQDLDQDVEREDLALEIAPGRRTMTARLARVLGDAIDETGKKTAVAYAVGQRGSGRAVPDQLRRPLEERLGGSLGDVRVHDDEVAASIVAALGAVAFTWGRDIFLGKRATDDVLAHEVGHAAQHAGSTPVADAKTMELGAEAGGEDFADRAAAARYVPMSLSIPGGDARVRFKGEGDVDAASVISKEMGTDEDKAKEMLGKASGDGRAQVEAAIKKNFDQAKADEIIKAVPAAGQKPPEVKGGDAAKQELDAKKGGKADKDAGGGAKGKGDAAPGGKGKGDAAPGGGDVAPAPGGDPSVDFGVQDLATGDLDLIHQELIEHERWKSAKDAVGDAGSLERFAFVVDQASRGAASGFATGAIMGLGGGLVTKLATRFSRVPGIGPAIAGGFSAYALLTKDWAESADTILKFGQGNDTYEKLANALASISEVLDILVNVANVIAGIVGIIAGIIWLVTIVTLGAAAPIAATLTSIAGTIVTVAAVVDDVNKLILQPCILLFRALHTFTSEADPRDVEAQGEGIAKAAAEVGGALGGKVGVKAGEHLGDIKVGGGSAGTPSADPSTGGGGGKETPKEAPKTGGEDPHAKGEDPHAKGEDPHAKGEDPHGKGTDPDPNAKPDPNADPNAKPDPAKTDPAKTEAQQKAADEKIAENKKKGLEKLREEWRKSRQEYEKALVDKKAKLHDNEKAHEKKKEDIEKDRDKKLDEIDTDRKKKSDAADQKAKDAHAAAEKAKQDAEVARKKASEAEHTAETADDKAKAADQKVEAKDKAVTAAEQAQKVAEAKVAAVEPKKAAAEQASSKQHEADVTASNNKQKAELDAHQRKLDADLAASKQQHDAEVAKAQNAVREVEAEYQQNKAEVEKIEDPDVKSKKMSELDAQHAKQLAEAHAQEDHARDQATTDQALADAKARTEKTLADDASAKANKERLDNANAEDTKRKAEAATQAAKEKADADAALADAQGKVKNAQAEAAQAKTDAEKAKLDADKAKDDAAKAKSDAGTAGDDAKKKEGAAGDADKTASSEKKKIEADAKKETKDAKEDADKKLEANEKDEKAEEKKLEKDFAKTLGGEPPKSEVGKKQVEDYWKKMTGQDAPKTEQEKKSAEEEKASQEAAKKGGDVGKWVGLVAMGPLGWVAGKAVGQNVGKQFPELQKKKQGQEERFTEDNRMDPKLGKVQTERVNPKYTDPPGSPEDLAAMKEAIVADLGIRAKADADEMKMKMELARSQGDKKKLAELEKQAQQGSEALKAHQAAVQRKDAANKEQEERAAKAKATMGGAASATGRMLAIRAPLKVFEGFTWVGKKVGSSSFAKMNDQAVQLNKRLDEWEAKMKQADGDQGPGKEKIDKDKKTVADTHKKAGDSDDKLQKGDKGRQDLNAKNEQKIGEAQAAKDEAAAVKAAREAAAEKKKQERLELSKKLTTWAHEHKAAREAAIQETKDKDRARKGLPKEEPKKEEPKKEEPKNEEPKKEEPKPDPGSDPNGPGDFPVPDPNGPLPA